MDDVGGELTNRGHGSAREAQQSAWSAGRRSESDQLRTIDLRQMNLASGRNDEIDIVTPEEGGLVSGDFLQKGSNTARDRLRDVNHARTVRRRCRKITHSSSQAREVASAGAASLASGSRSSDLP